MSTSQKAAKMALNAVRVSSRTNPPTAAVIFFHGLGDSGAGWKFFADMARQGDDFDHISFIFPNAPLLPITVNGGQSMPAWFDIQRFGEWTNNDDVQGYLKSLDVVDQYVEEQVSRGIPPERIIVGGFSQGGGLALGTAATSQKKFAGILAFSPATPFFKLLTEKKVDTNIETPIFHGHGTADPIVSYQAAQQIKNLFQKDLGFKNYTHEAYPRLAHSCSEDELAYAFKFINDLLPRK